MNREFQEMIDRLERDGGLRADEYAAFIRYHDESVAEELARRAAEQQQLHFQKRLLPIANIAFSSYCRNDCYYCALHRESRVAKRYRMTREQVVACCGEAVSRGIDIFLLQSGEDLQYAPADIARMVIDIKRKWPDSTVFLALGEKSRQIYRQWFEAGAEGYILRQEAAGDAYYRKLHPANMSLLRRKQCLWELKEIGYRVGAGFMMGSPWQKMDDVADELTFMKQLLPEMIWMGPFIPAPGTRFEKERAGSLELTCFVLSMLRLMFPQTILPVTREMDILDAKGNQKGVYAGANAVLIDFTPPELRSHYYAYHRRQMKGRDGWEKWSGLRAELWESGYELLGNIGT